MQDFDIIDGYIKAMCIIGGVLALSALLFSSLHGIVAILMLVVIPLGCCLLFWITEHPAFGITYTVLFFLTRIPALFTGGGTFLGAIIIILLLIYFIFVDCVCISVNKELSRREVEEVIKRHEESRSDSESDQEENQQFFNWPEN